MMRYERKFLVEALDRHQVKAMLMAHPAVFHQPYPSRFINNIYLDTPLLENYHANHMGASERVKVRVRWYGKLLGEISQPVLEYKIKSGVVGTKRQYPLPSFTIERGFSDVTFRAVIDAADLSPEIRNHVLMMRITLVNRYQRAYYAVRGNTVRATVDWEITYIKANHLRNQFLHRQVDHQHVIVELKYPSDQELRANRIASAFPFRLTRSSKYVMGIERVYL